MIYYVADMKECPNIVDSNEDGFSNFGCMEARFPFPDGEYEKVGMDTLSIYRPDEFSVVKLRKLKSNTEWYINAFNMLFGDRAAYKIIGSATNNDETIIKLRQPYVEFGMCTWEEARKELYYDMKRKFGDAEEHPWMPYELHVPGYFIDDLKEDNVGIDIRTGKYAVIDCIIHATSSVNHELRWDLDKRWLKEMEDGNER